MSAFAPSSSFGEINIRRPFESSAEGRRRREGRHGFRGNLDGQDFVGHGEWAGRQYVAVDGRASAGLDAHSSAKMGTAHSVVQRKGPHGMAYERAEPGKSMESGEWRVDLTR